MNIRAENFFLGFMAAVSLALGGCIVEEKCSGDTECGDGQICVDGSCESGCRLSRDCPDEQRCVANECIAEADGDVDGDVDCSVTCSDDMVPICGYCMDIYEASRQDATEDSQGTDDSIATSRAGVMPWIIQDREVAKAACEAAGKRLCLHNEWIDACRGPQDLEYPYGDAYVTTTCNGIDTFGLGSQHLMPTGSFEDCTNEYGTFDLSGNVWEIDSDMPQWVHGGAYNCRDSALLHMCSYNQDLAGGMTVGFRCCSDGV